MYDERRVVQRDAQGHPRVMRKRLGEVSPSRDQQAVQEISGEVVYDVDVAASAGVPVHDVVVLCVSAVVRCEAARSAHEEASHGDGGLVHVPSAQVSQRVERGMWPEQDGRVEVDHQRELSQWKQLSQLVTTLTIVAETPCWV